MTTQYPNNWELCSDNYAYRTTAYNQHDELMLYSSEGLTVDSEYNQGYEGYHTSVFIPLQLIIDMLTKAGYEVVIKHKE